MWKALTQQAFNHGGRTYDRLHAPIARGLHSRVVQDVAALDLPANGKALDAGTGPGRLAIALAEQNISTTGVDLAPSMIERAEHNATQAGVTAQTSFDIGDVADLPYDDDSFDLVVSTAALHHWTKPERTAQELCRVLKPTGYMRIYDARLPGQAAFRTALAREAGTPTRHGATGTGLLRWIVRISLDPR